MDFLVIIIQLLPICHRNHYAKFEIGRKILTNEIEENTFFFKSSLYLLISYFISLDKMYNKLLKADLATDIIAQKLCYSYIYS